MLKDFLLIVIAILIAGVAMTLQIKIFRRRHPNAELLADALKRCCGHEPLKKN